MGLFLILFFFLDAHKIVHLKNWWWDFPGGPLVKNLPSNAGEVGSIPGWGTKIPYAAGELSLHTTTTEFAHLSERARVPQTTDSKCSGPHASQLERENLHATTREKPRAATKSPCATTKDPAHLSEDPMCHN